MTTTAYQSIKARLANGDSIWLDAGTGTELQARGAPMHPDVWCGMAHMTNPDTVRQIHVDYINAGADIICANTFSTNRNMLDPAGLGDRVVEINQTAAALAIEARDQAVADRPIAVAGSMSHQIPIKPGTMQRRPDAVPPPEVARANFDEIAGIFKAAGVDMILMEMMSDPVLAKPAIAAALDTGLPVWIGMSCKMDDDGKLTAYSRPEISFDELCADIIDPRVEAVGIMHSSINYVEDAIATMKKHYDGPIMAYPDSGFFTMPDWNFIDIISPTDFAARSKDWHSAGAQILGGCCGLGVAHIDAMVSAHHHG